MNQGHITCSSSSEIGIPDKEFIYIKGQKEKAGSKRQMGGPDLPEHKRQLKKLERDRRQEMKKGRKRRRNDKNSTEQESFLPVLQDIERFL